MATGSRNKTPISVRLGIAATVAALLVMCVTLWAESLLVGVLLSLSAGFALFYYSRLLLAPVTHLSTSAKEKEELAPEFQQISEQLNAIRADHANALAEMRRLERVRTEFLGNVSHELRTPIFAVQGFIETLLDGAVDDPAVNRDFLERAHVQSARLNTLLNDLIDISRIESRAMRMSFRMFDIVPFLHEVMREMEPLAARRDVTLLLVPHEAYGMFVYADKERIKQVMINLIDNGIKYNREGGTLTVMFARKETTSTIEVSVEDTGLGIESEHLPRLFERFYRVDKDRSRATAGGTGLGLAIVKHIVEAHHGNISVTSVVGEGTRFTFTLHERPF